MREIIFHLFGFHIDFETKTFALSICSIEVERTRNLFYIQFEGKKPEAFDILFLNLHGI